MRHVRCSKWQMLINLQTGDNMKQTGYVTESDGNKIKVRVDRESACGGNCVSCKGCPTSAVIVECTAEGEVSVGDVVVLSMDNKTFFKSTFFGYGLITILALLGAILGYIIVEAEGASVLGAILGVAVGLGIAKLASGNDTITAKKYEKD